MYTVPKIIASTIILLFISITSFATAPLSPEEEKQYQQRVLKEVNHYRISKGLKTLTMRDSISAEARQHSLDMANNKMAFGHQDFDTRINHIKINIPDFGGGAENIACFKLPPETVVKKWLSSRGHKRNIDGNYNLTGIGIAKDKKGWVYYTQIFVRDNAANHGA